ncbi:MULTISPECIES: tautomerase family protein [unclassified Rhizobium]|uniref:tautomerase family protein n=1 Tax=unclassified Rhizobium TaxID=2613769 RepID=UPI001ADCFDB9|nr:MULTISPECIES: tautomerase family protein [unclassified Rhizobium]MBO9098234.1 tautomerase family protein [Rhizobium sp. L58/93]MBO9132961.1 tautomerase family protein [Rhizobium sp. B209b/85]MBO9168500.1 tautomerase family protein [Rhizobium sp. L245/93]MBO9184430.1 tautomerase family protein [Rhizobium sp. E27B/91]QXZ84638.1 tautomerase family protein [Rhizobium sp. K1/93]
MPLIKINVVRGRSPAETSQLLDTIHHTVVTAFNVPERDRYQLLNEYEPSHLKALDTGLDIQRSEKFILIEVVTRPRSREEKLNFYELMAKALHDSCGIASSDVMISIIENSDEDWSFGMGRAQFVTGELTG